LFLLIRRIFSIAAMLNKFFDVILGICFVNIIVHYFSAVRVAYSLWHSHVERIVLNYSGGHLFGDG
jgi:uncharacterized membrane protein YuzA (DUF378 family)